MRRTDLAYRPNFSEIIDTPHPVRINRTSARFSASVHSFGFALGDFLTEAGPFSVVLPRKDFPRAGVEATGTFCLNQAC
jgi:hypothetical protein